MEDKAEIGYKFTPLISRSVFLRVYIGIHVYLHVPIVHSGKN